MTEADWIETFVPGVTELLGNACRFGPVHVLYPDADASWHPATIDGRDALTRAACGKIDGVVFSDGSVLDANHHIGATDRGRRRRVQPVRRHDRPRCGGAVAGDT
jgi:hypothetical protein